MKIFHASSFAFFRRPLVRELTAVLTVKMVLLVLAATVLFGAATRPHIDAAVMAKVFFDPEPK